MMIYHNASPTIPLISLCSFDLSYCNLPVIRWVHVYDVSMLIFEDQNGTRWAITLPGTRSGVQKSYTPVV